MNHSIVPQVINIFVIIERVKSGGNAHKGKYQVTCVPDEVKVEHYAALLVYQLLPPTPEEITFVAYTDSNDIPPIEPITVKRQLSHPATVSVNGKLMAMFDANTVKHTINVNLQFQDSLHKKRKIVFDPQVGNDGRASP